MTEEFAAFYEYNQPVEQEADVRAATIAKYTGILPDPLLTLWKNDGLSALKDRFFRLTDPDDFTGVMPWFFADPENHFVILRTAFGGMVVFDQSAREENGKEAFSFLCPIYLTETPFTSALDAVLNGWLTTPEIYDPLMFHTLYTLARERLPAPEADECYGFAPAIALGGDLFPSQVKLFKWREHLLFLAQLKG